MRFTYHSFSQTHVTLTTIHDTISQRLTTSTLAHWQCFHVLLEIEIEVFEDEVELVAVCVYDVEQADNVGVVGFLEQGNLTNGCRRNTLILCLEANLLQSDDAVIRGCEVAGFVDDTVCTCEGLVVSQRSRNSEVGLSSKPACQQGVVAGHSTHPPQSSPSSDSSP